MKIRRRDLFSTAAVAGVGMMASTRLAAQDPPARGAGTPKPPTYAPKIETLWKSPDRYPNALEASPEGLWVGDQVSERINLSIGKPAKFLQDFVVEAHNERPRSWWRLLSGLVATVPARRATCGNSSALTKTRRDRQARHEGQTGEGYRTPWGSQHGTYYNRQTDKLWAVAPVFGLLVEMDPKDDLRISRMVQIRMNVPHGLDMLDGSFYVIDGADGWSTGSMERMAACRKVGFGPNDP